MGASTTGGIQMGLQIFQGIMGAAAQMSAASAAEEQAAAQVAELERQKEEVEANARNEKSKRAREADRQFASMVAAMADNGGLGTSNAAGFAGSIGYVAGMDFGIIAGNAARQINALSSRQQAAQMRAANARSQANFAAIGSIIQGAGGALTTYSKMNERNRQTTQQKNTAGSTPNVTNITAKKK